MSRELVISANRHETRVAVLEDDQLVEIYHQRENEYSLAGSIHKGRVTRVLPGMQSAFVDIGLGRDAFLYVSDFFEDNEEYDKVVTAAEERVLKLDRPVAVPPAAGVDEPASEAPATTAPSEAAVAPGEMPPAVLQPPASAMHGPGGERRGDRGDRNDRGDRRGRRSRRGRGGRGGGGGGRGLPDSKFYSPRQEDNRRYQAPPVAEEMPAPLTGLSPEEGDDLFVLPGESLAKYTEPSDAEAQAAREEVEGIEAEAAGETVESAPRQAAEPEPEPFEAVVPAEESTPDLLVREAVAEARAEGVQAAAEAVLEKEEAAVPVEEHMAVETVPEAEAEMEPAAETAEENPYEGPETETDLLQAAVEVLEAADASAAEAAVEEEGPEPARIPTSLTATLREQGQRHLHRISRRTRRRGRGGDRGPAQEGQPRPQGEGREQRLPGEGRVEPRTAPDRRVERSATPSISDLLKEGQEIIVQIAKEPLGQKGARITSHIALPGRFLVFMPTVDHIGVSRKIPSDEERQRLKRVLQNNRTGIPGGFIVRTAGEGRSEEELRADMHFLYNLWLDLRQKAERRSAPALIHHDLNVVERILRDQLTSAYKTVWVDNEEVYEAVLRFVQRFQPALVNRVRMYTRPTPVFDEFGITAELEKALRPKVWLKSGGYIVINQTEALVAIDINTGKYVGKSARLEDTIVKTNTDAIKEIVRQIRLRDLGGIIVVDFIDMDERKNRQKVMQALEEAMRADRAPYKILQFNDFGLVAITRKRVKQSLERTLCTPCPYCEGAGYVKSPQTVVGEILQEAQKIAKAIDTQDVLLRVSPEVAKLLKSNQNTYLQELEEILGRTVFVKSDHQLHQEKFDLA
ncbi:MAG TPA: Rne/Rng family ribonuclease [Candidatus Acidoferrales bacterium]|nr:Rne/Rng family ribonuclease [Candidatus Acidoferrales bacterium]